MSLLFSSLEELFPQHCQVPFLMWNKHLKEVIDKLVITIQEMPPNKCNHVLTLVAEKFAAGQLNNPKRSLTHPGQEWILPQGNLQRAPYVCPNKQRVPKQRVPKRRVTLDDAEPTNNMLPQLLSCITNAPPIMLVPNPTTR
jgi:hypothetical protein